MRIAVLLSVGRHPASGRTCPVRVEAQAVRLAAECGGEIVGLHAGPGDDGPLTEHLGTGLAEIVLLEIPAGTDPVPSLVASLAEHAPDLILAGRRGQGGEDTGLVPYAVAAALGRPIVAEAAALALAEGDPGALVVDQALPRGERRRVTVRLPALVTVHPAAPPPLPFAYGAARRGRIVRRPGIVASPVATPDLAERPYRKRPRLIARTAAGASAADRLKAATEAASGGGRVLVDPAPDLAAAEILAFLRGIGVLERRCGAVPLLADPPLRRGRQEAGEDARGAVVSLDRIRHGRTLRDEATQQ